MPFLVRKDVNMKRVIKTKLFLVGLFFLLLGILSLAMENIFYGDIDQDGVLQESFFLPLGSISVIMGVASLTVSIIWFYLKKMKEAGSTEK